MGDTDFYITLPSNANMDEYPDNRPGKFKVNLSHKRELHDGVWEIGLSEIQFTPNWRYHTPPFDMVVWVGHFRAVENRYKSRPANYNMSNAEKELIDVHEAKLPFSQMVSAYIQVPAGKWFNEYEFGDSLAHRIKKALDKMILDVYPEDSARDDVPLLFKVAYFKDYVTKKTKFEMIGDNRFLGITTTNHNIMSTLGISARLEDATLLEAAGKKVRAYMFDADAIRCSGGFPSLETIFVYSSVCEEQHIGDQVGNLLKTIPVTEDLGKRQCERYSTPTYVRLRPSTLESIDIELRDKTGAEVGFDDLHTMVVMQLHVRKRRTSSMGWC